MPTQQEVLQNNLEKIKQWFQEHDEEKLKRFTEYFEPHIKNFVVYMPLLGAFSAGKSTLLNVLAEEKKLLKTDVNRETAIPAELFYSDNPQIIARCDNERKSLTRDDLQKGAKELSQIFHNTFGAKNNINSYLEIGIGNPEWKKFRHIHLIDLPGLGSNDQSHDSAINNFLPRSLGFILVVPIASGTLQKDIKDFLEEISHLIDQKPIILIFTKCGKTPDQNVIDNFTAEFGKVADKDYIYKTLTFGNYILSVERQKIKEGFIEVLSQIEEKDLGIIFSRNIATKVIFDLKEFLRDKIEIQANAENKQLEEFEEEKRKLENEKEEVRKKNKQLGQKFLDRVEDNIIDIKDQVKQEYLSNVDRFCDIAFASGKNEMNDRISKVIQDAVEKNVRKFYQPTVEKYLKDAANILPSNLQIHVPNLQADIKKEEDDYSGIIGFLGSGGVLALTQFIPAISRFLGPIGVAASVILPLLPKIFSLFSSNAAEQEARIKAKENLREQLRAQSSIIEDNIGEFLQENLKSNALEIQQQYLEKSQKDIQNIQDQITAAQNNLNDLERRKVFTSILTEVNQLIEEVSKAEPKIC